MKYYVDAMGGDHAPMEIIKGTVDAVNEYGIHVTLIGQENVLRQHLSQYKYDSNKIEILHAKTTISMDDDPILAIRNETESSIVIGLEAVKNNPESVLISAGSTGALLTGGTLILGRMKGIKRPALATTLPKKNGVTLMLDSGANADCKPDYLEQFARIGSIYMESIHNVQKPKVGLINIGVEEQKGNLLTKEAFKKLSDSPINFIGNIESRDLLVSDADVLVTDGFTGNIVLKLMEGMLKFLMSGIKGALLDSTKGKLGGLLIKSDMKKFAKGFNPDEHGGAPLLGVKGGLIKAHGSSNAYAIKNAIRQSILFTDNEVLRKIEESFK